MALWGFTDSDTLQEGKSNPKLQNKMVIQSIHDTNVVATKSLPGHYPIIPKESVMWKFAIRCHRSPALIFPAKAYNKLCDR